MEHIAGDQHHIGRDGDRLLDRAVERPRYIRLALVDAARSHPLILAVTEVEIREVYETQRQ